MKRFISIFLAITLSLAAFSVIALPQVAEAQSSKESLCRGSGGEFDPDTGACTTKGSDRTVLGTIKQVTNTLLFLLGAIGVIMVIIGGLRYVTSSGDQTAITNAKNTILYAVIGLIVAFMAYAIVNFIFTAFKV